MNRRAQGSAAEEVAMRYLEQKGYKTLARNYTIRGGEIDLIMRAPQGTLAVSYTHLTLPTKLEV